MSTRDASGERRRRDPILGPLGEAMRAGGSRDPFGALDPADEESWEALAEGRLDDEAAAALHAKVAAGGLPEVAWEAMQPLTERDRGAMVEAMLAAREQRREEPRATAAPERAEGVISIGDATVRGKRWRRPLAALLASTALVATGTAYVLLLRPSPPAALPAYSFEVEGVDRESRGAPGEDTGELVVLGPGARLRVILRPEEAVQGAVEARVFTRIGDAVSPSSVAAQPLGNGVFVVDARREQLFPAVPGGEAELLLVTARPGHVPEARALQETMVDAESRVTRLHVRLRAAPPPGRPTGETAPTDPAAPTAPREKSAPYQ